VTITNDDAQPVLTVTASDDAGAEAANDPITFLITRSANLTGAITVTLQWSGAALLGSDFTVSATGGTLTNGTRLALADGVASATLTVRPINDTAIEPTESVILTVASGTGYTPGTPAQATGSITDNDGALTASAPPPPAAAAAPAPQLASAPAGQPAPATATASAPAGQPAPATATASVLARRPAPTGASSMPLSYAARRAPSQIRARVGARPRRSCSRGRRMQALACAGRWIVVRPAARLRLPSY
jgi:hypothetical protein